MLNIINALKLSFYNIRVYIPGLIALGKMVDKINPYDTDTFENPVYIFVYDINVLLHGTKFILLYIYLNGYVLDWGESFLDTGKIFKFYLSIGDSLI